MASHVSGENSTEKKCKGGKSFKRIDGGRENYRERKIACQHNQQTVTQLYTEIYTGS